MQSLELKTSSAYELRSTTLNFLANSVNLPANSFIFLTNFAQTTGRLPEPLRNFTELPANFQEPFCKFVELPRMFHKLSGILIEFSANFLELFNKLNFLVRFFELQTNGLSFLKRSCNILVGSRKINWTFSQIHWSLNLLASYFYLRASFPNSMNFLAQHFPLSCEDLCSQ